MNPNLKAIASKLKIHATKTVSTNFKLLKINDSFSIFEIPKQVSIGFIFCWIALFSMTHASVSLHNGNYIIDFYGYDSNNVAVFDLDTIGFSSSCSFNIQSGSYMKQVVLNAITDASKANINRVESGNAVNVNLRFKSSRLATNYSVNLAAT